jgi:hypothetical protein
MADLITEHLQIGAEIITALRDKESAKADELTKQWFANADKMADFFNSINPYYAREEMKNMLYTHLKLTTHEVEMRLAKDYKADIDAFDEVEREAMSMADYFTSGLVRLFPNMLY